MKPAETAHQETIPSPLAYLMKMLDHRQEARCDYSFEMLLKLVLMAIGAGSENILAVSRWVQDFRVEFSDCRGHTLLPAQATA